MTSQPRIICIDCRSRLADPGSAWCTECRPRRPIIAGKSSTAPERYGLVAMCLFWFGMSAVLWTTEPEPRSFGAWLSGALFAVAIIGSGISARAWREHRRSRS